MKDPKLLPWQAAATLFPAELVYMVTCATKGDGSAAGLLMVGASQVDDEWLHKLNVMSNRRLSLKHSKILGFEGLSAREIEE